MFRSLPLFNPRFFRFYTCTRKNLSLCISPWIGLMFLASSSMAALPDPQTDPKYRELLSTALSEHLSSFQYSGEDPEVTYVLGFHKNFEHVLGNRSKRELQRLLINPRTKYQLKKTLYFDRLSIYLYQASFPKGTLPNSLEFSLTPLSAYTNEEIEEAGLPQLDSRNKLSLRVKLTSLTQTYLRERRASSLMDNLRELDLALKQELTPERKDLLETQKFALTHEITAISNPIEKLKYILEHLTPMAFRDYPTLAFLQILQEAKLVAPALTDATLLAAQAEDQISVEVSASAEAKNCMELGGRLEVYTKGKSEEALLCRFGEAGIGAASLYQFKNKVHVKSILAYLNYTPYVSSTREEAAIVPSSKLEEGRPPTSFVLRSTPPAGSKMEAGMKLILNPSVKVSEYCRQREGKPTQLHQKTDGSEFKACIFNDYSGIDAKTLFAGPESPTNARLTSVLRSLQ